MGFTDQLTVPTGLNLATNPTICKPIAPVMPIDPQNINTRSNPEQAPDYARLSYELERFKMFTEIHKNDQKK